MVLFMPLLLESALLHGGLQPLELEWGADFAAFLESCAGAPAGSVVIAHSALDPRGLRSSADAERLAVIAAKHPFTTECELMMRDEPSVLYGMVPVLLQGGIAQLKPVSPADSHFWRRSVEAWICDALEHKGCLVGDVFVGWPLTFRAAGVFLIRKAFERERAQGEDAGLRYGRDSLMQWEPGIVRVLPENADEDGMVLPACGLSREDALYAVQDRLTSSVARV